MAIMAQMSTLPGKRGLEIVIEKHVRDHRLRTCHFSMEEDKIS